MCLCVYECVSVCVCACVCVCVSVCVCVCLSVCCRLPGSGGGHPDGLHGQPFAVHLRTVRPTTWSVPHSKLAHRKPSSRCRRLSHVHHQPGQEGKWMKHELCCQHKVLFMDSISEGWSTDTITAIFLMQRPVTSLLYRFWVEAFVAKQKKDMTCLCAKKICVLCIFWKVGLLGACSLILLQKKSLAFSGQCVLQRFACD